MENCVEICLALGKTRVDVLVDMYLGMLADRELAVRRGILASLPRLAGALLTLAEMDTSVVEAEVDAETETENSRNLTTQQRHLFFDDIIYHTFKGLYM